MKKALLYMTLTTLLAGVWLFGSGIVLGQGTDTDFLWQKAIDFIIQHRTWVPGKIYSRDEEKDGKGKVNKVTESWSRLYLDEKGKIGTELIKVLENGKDITSKARQEMEKAKKSGQAEASQETDPFSPEQLKKLTYQAKERGTVNNRSCRAFSFRQKIDEKQSQKGWIWVDEKTGAPMEISFEPDPLPKGIKAMKTTIKYSFDEDGTWYADKMTAEGNGSFFGMKMGFSSVAILSDYWKCPESALDK